MIKVLVVDDDQLVRKGIISAMPWDDFGMQVVGEASNGKKALEFMEANAVNLLLTDLSMPVMSGIELIRVVRNRMPHVQIVVLTVHQDFEYIQEALRLGAIDYIAKVQLEKEQFDEVLQRFSKRYWEHAQVRAQHAGLQENDKLYVDQGCAWISLNEWFEGESIQLLAGNSIPDVHIYDREGVMVRLQGINGLSVKEVYRRLKIFREQDLFYEYEPTTHEYVLSFHNRDVVQNPGMEARIQAIKESLTSLEWLRDDILFRTITDALKQLRLPKPRLFGMLYAMVDGWNRMLYPIASFKIEWGVMNDYWYQVEQRLLQIRDLMNKGIEKPGYSQEIVSSVMNAMSIIEQEMSTQLTANHVANKVNLSRSYFSQCFKDVVGSTFNEVVRQTRISKAKEYLQHTNNTISWIAEKVGYMDEKYFSNLFREMTGILPSEYRLKNQ